MSNESKVYGTYIVTTEGDCEGRSTRHLGTHTGYVDEIAFLLADKCYYSLHFREIKPDDLPVDRGAKQVFISGLNIGSGENRVGAAAKLFADRPVQVRSASQYGAVKLQRNISPEVEARIARDAALAKLSPADRAALGV